VRAALKALPVSFPREAPMLRVGQAVITTVPIPGPDRCTIKPGTIGMLTGDARRTKDGVAYEVAIPRTQIHAAINIDPPDLSFYYLEGQIWDHGPTDHTAPAITLPPGATNYTVVLQRRQDVQASDALNIPNPAIVQWTRSSCSEQAHAARANESC